jgi:hypothetical protein
MRAGLGEGWSGASRHSAQVMHFDWTIRRGGTKRVAKSLIPCGFPGPISLFYADNVHAGICDSCEAVDALPRFSFTQIREKKNALFLPLLPGNSGRVMGGSRRQA